jgi:hypothetical protein
MSAQEINIACREITPAEKKSETGGGGGVFNGWGREKK